MLALVENSKAHTQLFDAWGLADLELHLDFAPYLDDAAIVSTPQGAFTEVDSFLDSGPNDRHFVVAVDQNDLQDGRRQRGQDLQRLLSLNISSGELPDDAKAPRWLSVICERKASRPPLHLAVLG